MCDRAMISGFPWVRTGSIVDLSVPIKGSGKYSGAGAGAIWSRSPAAAVAFGGLPGSAVAGFLPGRARILV
jgi:hypothetical protein